MSERDKQVILIVSIVLIFLVSVWREMMETLENQEGEGLNLPSPVFNMPSLIAPDFGGGSNRCNARSSCGCDNQSMLRLDYPNLPPAFFNYGGPSITPPPGVGPATPIGGYSPRPRITIHKEPGQSGFEIPLDKDTPNLKVVGMNDRTRSITVHGGRWQFCRDVNYGGPCVTLGPGRYSGVADLGGLYKNISSMRVVN